MGVMFPLFQFINMSEERKEKTWRKGEDVSIRKMTASIFRQCCVCKSLLTCHLFRKHLSNLPELLLGPEEFDGDVHEKRGR